MVTLDALKLKEGLDQFNASAEIGDINLVDMLYEAMVNQGFSSEQLGNYNNHHLIIDVVNKQPHVQRWQLNRFWFLQLIKIEAPTMDVRKYLVSNGTDESWLELIVQYVLPVIKEHNLPGPT